MDKVVVINSERMGVGNEELGARLIGNFLKTLVGAEKKPQALVLYNTGMANKHWLSIPKPLHKIGYH